MVRSPIWRKRLLDRGRYRAHVGLAGEPGLDDAHHLAHVARPRSADLGDDLRDFGSDLVGAQPLRQVALEHRDLGRFLGDQVVAAGLLERRDRIAPLLDQLVDDADGLRVVERDALVDLALLDRSEQHADRRQPFGRRLRAHRGLHVFGDAVFQGHVEFTEANKPATASRAGFGVGCRNAQ